MVPEADPSVLNHIPAAELAQKAGVAEVVGRVVLEIADKSISTLGAHDEDQRLEEQLIDDVLVAFQIRIIIDDLADVITFVDLHAMQPSTRNLLPRSTTILRNRRENVQENTIEFVCDEDGRYGGNDSEKTVQYTTAALHLWWTREVVEPATQVINCGEHGHLPRDASSSHCVPRRSIFVADGPTRIPFTILLVAGIVE
ncbi:predicted protein [Plenodomus lingam JN3]|uniref:Predicted protein n=1 Tax=Leptosphaeria maculans (strain JN3 / isolate v23.1.3 / race Av1-4-5-6-7-8) TaxID=985895 RepID=E4ZJP1_LEPMJ|nr:predicted protein [Plenodomus lingam JN3]CBX91326.1 predicted protein [Plenodomus lingam JN3]